MSEDTKCFLETLKACCCVCGNRDDDGKTCCYREYIVKEHGYCQSYKDKTEN